jgi:hypothetical protein
MVVYICEMRVKVRNAGVNVCVDVCEMRVRVRDASDRQGRQERRALTLRTAEQCRQDQRVAPATLPALAGNIGPKVLAQH